MTQASHFLACYYSAQISWRRRTKVRCCCPSPLLARPSLVITVTVQSVSSFSPRQYCCSESQPRLVPLLYPERYVCSPPYLRPSAITTGSGALRIDGVLQAHVCCATPECSRFSAVPADTGNSPGESEVLGVRV